MSKSNQAASDVMPTTTGVITEEQVDIPSAMEELRSFLTACFEIENIEIKVIREWRLRREYDRLSTLKQ